MSDVDAGHRELLRALAAHDVDFVLVGGVALQLHGYSGATRDVDVTIAVDEDNTARVGVVLAQLHAVPYLAGDRGGAYRTDLGQLEIMRSTDGVGDYAAWKVHAVRVELESGLHVDVGAPSDLLASKEAAGRSKDLEVLPRIRAELLRAGTLHQVDVRGPVAELPDEPAPDPRAHELLGARPEERRARGLWDHGAQIINDYRQRWQIAHDTPHALGLAPDPDSDQASDRQAVDRQLQRTQRLLARLGHGPTDIQTRERGT